MGRRHRRRVVALGLAAALGLAGCGGSASEATDVLWRAEDASASLATTDVRLAQAGTAEAGPGTSGRIEPRDPAPILVRLDRRGRFEANGLEGSGDEEGRRTLLRALEQAPERSYGRDLLFRFDRDAAWGDVAAVFEGALDAKRWWHRWRFAVESPRARSQGADAEIEARVVGSRRLVRWYSPFGVRGSVSLDRVEDVVLVRHRDGEERIPVGDPYSSAVVPAANAGWERLRRALAAGAFDRLELAVGDRVPWSHVVEVLVIALDVHTAEIAVRRPEVVLTISAPSMSPDQAAARDPRDAPWWLPVAIGAGAALLLFGRQLRDPRRAAARSRARTA